MSQSRRAAKLLLPLWVVGLCCCGAIGCTVGGRSVSIDSNSRIPFFGLELQERQRKSNGPPVRSIRSEQKSVVRIEPLGLTPRVGKLARLGEKWDRQPNPLATLAVPRTDAGSARAASGEQATVQIDFR